MASWLHADARETSFRSFSVTRCKAVIRKRQNIHGNFDCPEMTPARSRKGSVAQSAAELGAAAGADALRFELMFSSKPFRLQHVLCVHIITNASTHSTRHLPLRTLSFSLRKSIRVQPSGPCILTTREMQKTCWRIGSASANAH